MVDYPTGGSTTAAPEWTALCEHLDNGDLAGATALVDGPTSWSRDGVY